MQNWCKNQNVWCKKIDVTKSKNFGIEKNWYKKQPFWCKKMQKNCVKNTKILV